MAKVHSMTFIAVLLFTGALGFVLTLENVSHIGGILGILATLFFSFMTYRKKLLNAGFSAFSNQYRIEMDEFKNEVFRYIDDMRKLMNKNEDAHKNTLKQIVDLNLETQKQVSKQTGMCKLIQGKKEVQTKSESDWRKNMENKTADIFDDVEEMKETIAYIKGKINGKA
jgi:hypothetical protein